MCEPVLWHLLHSANGGSAYWPWALLRHKALVINLHKFLFLTSIMADIKLLFTASTALQKVKFSQNAWNTKNLEAIAKGGFLQAARSLVHRYSRQQNPYNVLYFWKDMSVSQEGNILNP
jgi:hypothetical protein